MSLTLALAGMLSVQAHAGEAIVEASLLAAAPVNAVTQDDLVALFGVEEAGKPMQLTALSDAEMRETEGAWGALAGAGVGAWNYLGSSAGSGRFTLSGLGYHDTM